MIIPDMKRAITTIMARRKGPEGSPPSDYPVRPEISKDEDGEPNALHAAASDMMQAIHEKSPQKLMEAMSAFHDLYEAKEPTEIEE